MKKIIILLCCFFFTNICHAEIIKQDNQIISYHKEAKLNDFIYGTIFKKYDNQFYVQSKLLHSLNKGGYVVLLEDAKIITDKEISYLPIRTSEVYCGFRQKFSIKLSDNIVTNIKHTNKLDIVLPYYKDGSDLFVQYKTITIPTDILSEWKQVISM